MISSEFFVPYLKSTSSFKHFEEKDDPNNILGIGLTKSFAFCNLGNT